MSSRAKVITAVVLAICTICAIFFTLLARQNRQNLQGFISSKTESAQIVATTILTMTGHQYERRIQSFVNYKTAKSKEQIVKAFANRDRQRLLKKSKPFLNLLKKENPYFASLAWILPDNTVFLRVHKSGNFGQNVRKMRPDVVAVNKDQRPRSGFSTGYMGLQYRVVQPVFYQGEYLGALQFGIKADLLLDTIIKQLKTPAGLAIANSEYAFILPKYQKGIAGPTHTIISNDFTLFKEILPASIDWDKAKQTFSAKEQTFIVSNVSSLKDFQGKELGVLFVAMDISPETDKSRALLFFAFFLSVFLAALSFLIIYYSYGALIQKIVDLNQSLSRNNRKLEERVEERTKKLITEVEERKITETKLNKAEKMEAIGLMAGGVAHDLNNILSGVVSYPELLLMKLPEESDLRRPIAAIHESGLRAAAVVSDLLTVARSAAKVCEVAQINNIIQEYLTSLDGQKVLELYPEVKVKTTLASDLDNIACSPIHVRKCLMNLVINAAEAIADSGTVIISTENRHIEKTKEIKELHAGEYVALIIADNGPGIPAADLEHIFEPFYTKKKMGRSGTGIGLAVVWNAMQDHDGHIQVESNDQGTTFTLLFPATIDAKEEKRPLPIATQVLQGNNEKILVVDDETHQRDIAAQILTLLGYNVTTVSSGEEAIDYMETGEADLILLDMLMEPGINGRQTYEKIIKKHPHQKAAIVSGFSENEDVKEAHRLGAHAFIKKPYTLEELGVAIKKELQDG